MRSEFPLHLEGPELPARPKPARLDRAKLASEARIVIVDDEPLNCCELETFLRSIGYQQVVTIVPEGNRLDNLCDERPDLILLELALKQPAAFDVLAWINADRGLRDVPVIVMTAQDVRSERLHALALGAVDCLVKPIDAADFELRLRNMLATKRYHERLAYTDGLTGLPNRDSSIHRLDWALKLAHRHERPGAVLQVGLDRFKQMNEAMGPAVGDELLRAVAQRLVACVRETDVVSRDIADEATGQVARSDGDEFTVLLPVMARGDQASVVARRIVESMGKPFMLCGHEIFASCQIGIALFPGDANDKDMVLRQAKLAMRHGPAERESGASGFRFHSQELNVRSAERLALEGELHHALEREELVLHYQPKVDLTSGRIFGAEALVRWQHPERGLLGPGAFIEAAEESGLIVPLGEWVLREALRQVALWRQQGSPTVVVAVNVSGLQFRRTHLDRIVGDALTRAKLDGDSLCLELTESSIMETSIDVTGVLHAIRELGVKISLDDFGTGYSSLSHLRSFPIDELKIDRSFIAECHADTNNATIITRAIIAMAHGLRLRVVAEGVETQQQLDFLRSTSCDQYQGYLFSKPVPATEFQALLGNTE